MYYFHKAQPNDTVNVAAMMAFRAIEKYLNTFKYKWINYSK